MAMKAAEIEALVKQALPDAKVEITDLAGDGDHYSMVVTSAAFAGKNRVEQHRMVNAAFGGQLGTKLHALSVTTKVS